MKSLKRFLGVIALSFVCVVTAMGYASISSTLRVRGEADLSPPKAIFITNVSGEGYLTSEATHSGTVLTSEVRLVNGVATYTVTVLNNTDVSYYYSAMIRSSDESGALVYSNPNISMSVEGISRGDEIRPGARKTFTVRANFKDGASTADPTLRSIIEYRFSTTKPTTNANDEAVTGVLAEFPTVLNDPDRYQFVVDTMNDKNGRSSATYIGNVKGADDDDVAAIEELFGEKLTLNVNGEDIPVSLMIKRDNIDGNEQTGDTYKKLTSITYSGGEMTLYITADPLTDSGGDAVVYVVVYTMDQSTKKWYQLGEVYQGNAPIRRYDALFDTGTGSFNTDKWESVAKTYAVTSNYSYTVSKDTSINNIVQAKDNNANAELLRLVQQAQNIVSDGRYMGDDVLALEELIAKYKGKYYTVNATATVSISGNPTRAEIIPIIKEFDSILKNFT